jgi:hypothetical protein
VSLRELRLDDMPGLDLDAASFGLATGIGVCTCDCFAACVFVALTCVQAVPSFDCST